MTEHEIEFRELPLPSGENQIFRIFYVIDKGRSQVMDGFQTMTDQRKDEVKTLIIKMATVEGFESQKIRWHLQKKYTYGELKPKGHRIFFFVKQGNIIFFRYSRKKTESLGDKFYRETEILKRRYENGFEKRL
jgi:hypothetical protein